MLFRDVNSMATAAKKVSLFCTTASGSALSQGQKY